MKKKPIPFFYDTKYQNYQHPNPETLLEKLYVLLRRFELHRNQAAVSLLRPAKRILDVGAGYGALLKLASERGFTQLYGIDISPVVVKHCRAALTKEKISAEITCQNIDVGTTYKDNFFDAVTIVAVLEHVFSPHETLAQIHRLLRKGGELVIEVPNVVFLPRRLSFLLGKLPKTSDEPSYEDGHLQFFTHDSLKKLLADHGYEVTYQGSSGIFSNLRNIWPQLLGANIIIKATKV